MPIFVKIPNVPKVGEITGTAQWKGAKYINCDSCEFEIEREMTEGTAAAKNREWKAPQITALSFNKKIDDSSGALAAWSVGGGSPSGDIEVHMVRTGGKEGYEAYLVYKIKFGIISHFAQTFDDSPEEKGTEEFTISFLEIEIVFNQFNEDGSQQANAGGKGYYNLAEGKG
jgi:type VI protein secretion system component Hcp